MAWRTGDRVLQPLYGVGNVVDIGGNRITVAFDDGQMRKFVASIVHLLPSDAHRPERPPLRTRSGRARTSALKAQAS